MRDDKQQQLKIELLSQWKLEAESRNFFVERHASRKVESRKNTDACCRWY